ncbi:MAG: prefoldin subunit, partial [Spirochaeta sp.]|nr:prefoldin subunit [Spirochaeta sp.]
KRFEQVDKRFEQVDKRFEQVDKRFEQVDKRFEELRADMNARFQDMHTYSSRWFTVISIVLAALTVAVTVSNFVG